MNLIRQLIAPVGGKTFVLLAAMAANVGGGHFL
jgi:hypothetical protein